jgi:type I restriction enzyme S subunit
LTLVGLGEFPAEDDTNTVFPDTMIAARLRKDLVDKMYLSIAWKQGSIRRQIESLARTTNGTAKVNQAALESIELLLPPLRAQEGFSLLYDRGKQMLKSCESIEGCLEKLTSSLQHEFFKL